MPSQQPQTAPEGEARALTANSPMWAFSVYRQIMIKTYNLKVFKTWCIQRLQHDNFSKYNWLISAEFNIGKRYSE